MIDLYRLQYPCVQQEPGHTSHSRLGPPTVSISSSRRTHSGSSAAAAAVRRLFFDFWPAMTMIGIIFVLFWSSLSAFPGEMGQGGCEKPPAHHFGVRVPARSAVSKKFLHGEKLRCVCPPRSTRSPGKCVIQCLDGTWSRPTVQCKREQRAYDDNNTIIIIIIIR